MMYRNPADIEAIRGIMTDSTQETTANSTWSRMLAGNRRFAEGNAEHPWRDKETRESLIDTQNPDAAVLSCSDSRVPPEIIFDAGLGDMFTVRTAGEMLDQAVLQTLEYAVSSLHVSSSCSLTSIAPQSRRRRRNSMHSPSTSPTKSPTRRRGNGSWRISTR